jgi:uncharacterized membrane protein YdjX (TVP38/TMEM64 family)
MKPNRTDEPGATSRRRGVRTLRRLAPLAVLGAVTAVALGAGLHDYLSFEALRENRGLLIDFVDSRFALALGLFVALYGLAVAVSLPGGALLTITGGFLFEAWLGTLAAVTGATLGATAVFLIARTAFGEALRARAGPAVRKMQGGFQKNALSYLLVLRLVPLFPFWLVNLVPAFLGVPLRTYVIGTFIGIIPGAFVFTFAGAGLGGVLDSAESFSPAAVLTPEVIAALVGLAILSLVPVGYKTLKARGA